IDMPQPVWQVLRARGRVTRSWGARLPSVTPLVSREQEIAILKRLWKQAEGGEGQVAGLSGEPGIGKSRLASIMKDHAADRRDFCVTLQCSSQETDTAFHPVIHALERVLGARSSSSNYISEHLGQLLGI